jgi:hypothetical protein
MDIVKTKESLVSNLRGQYVWYVLEVDETYVYWRLYKFNGDGTALENADTVDYGSTYHIIQNNEYVGSDNYTSPS